MFLIRNLLSAHTLAKNAQSSSGFCIRKVNSMTTLTTLDTIANLKLIALNRLTLIEPEYQLIQALPIGQVGTILEIYPGESESPCYLVEFADLQGREYAMAVLQSDEILALHYELSLAS
jgi:hypothetical protein